MVAIKTEPYNCGYIAKQIKKAMEANVGGTKFEKKLIWLNNCKGETFNNMVTMGGTAFIAPFFIIHNPLAKEDKQTKEYTAARQPISAFITIAAQVPIMGAYNNWLDKMSVKYHFDKCDLVASPPKSYLKDGINQDYKNHLYKKSIGDREALSMAKEFKTKKELKEAFYNKRKYQAFYDELGYLRKSVREGNVPDYLKKSFRANGLINIEDMISRNDIKDAGKQLVKEYMAKEFKVDIAKDLGLPDNVKIESLDSFNEIKVKKALKAKGIDFTKEHKKALKNIIQNESPSRARVNVGQHLIAEARVKLYTHKIYAEAKLAKADYVKRVTMMYISQEEKARMLAIRDDEILNNLKTSAERMIETAPDKMPKSVKFKNLNVDNIVPTKSELATVIQKINQKLELKDRGAHRIEYLRTSEGRTFKDLLKSVQVKRWLKARINNSQNYLSDFKQKSGILVGLAILPLTCGLLNWAYPRIMEEWFPELANAKKASVKAKEAK